MTGEKLKEQKQEWDANTLCIPYIYHSTPPCMHCVCSSHIVHQYQTEEVHNQKDP